MQDNDVRVYRILEMNKFVIMIVVLFGLCACQSTSSSPSTDNTDISNAIENRKFIKPIVMITAKYPEQEYRAGVEGSCKVSFDLADLEKFGSAPTNIKPIECTNKNFEKMCTTALSYWRFKSLEDIDKRESPTNLIYTCNFELS